jgi:MGT family glycosyltransferase
VADLRGLPWATSATTPVELIAWQGNQHADQAADWLDPATVAYLTKVRDWLQETLRQLCIDLGMSPERAEVFDVRYSPYLLLAFTTPEMLGFDMSFPDHFALVGPSLGDRPPASEFPWEWLDESKPLVYVTVGTINFKGAGRFFRTAAEALAGEDVQVVVTAPEGVDFDPPANMLVRKRVPQLDLLDRVDAVVCHGGQNTVAETLAVGRPLVIAPIRDDQPIIADQVSRAGAGLTVRYARVTADQLREAVHSVLTEKSYRAAAERLQAAFVAAGGPPVAADRLEALLPGR